MKQSELNNLLVFHSNKLKDFKPSKAVHYCNIDTFNKIIAPFVEGKKMKRYDGKLFSAYEAKYVCFFATDINYLNDREEYNIGKAQVKRVAGPFLKENIEEIFVACFCDSTDNLTQWKYYGKETGLAVEFDTEDVVLNYCDKCTCINGTKEPVEYPLRHDISFMPFEVFYTPRIKDSSEDELNEAELRIRKMLPKGKELNSITKQTAKLSIIPYIKHKAFEDENESRITLYHSEHCNVRCSSTKYRSSTVIKPYLDIRMFYGNPKAEKYIPIKSVTVGPSANQDLFVRSIFHALEEDYAEREKNIDKEIENGFVETTGGIIIRKSSIPFRS